MPNYAKWTMFGFTNYINRFYINYANYANYAMAVYKQQ